MGRARSSLPTQSRSICRRAHKAGAADHAHPASRAGRLALAGLERQISAKRAGRKHRITADPVVAGGRVFTLDSRARVSAISTAGRRSGRPSLTPPSDRTDDASGGGLAVGGGAAFRHHGLRHARARSTPATGETLWRQDLDAAATGAPTVVGDTVYAVSRDSRGWAIDADNGRVQWQVTGPAQPCRRRWRRRPGGDRPPCALSR